MSDLAADTHVFVPAMAGGQAVWVCLLCEVSVLSPLSDEHNREKCPKSGSCPEDL